MRGRETGRRALGEPKAISTPPRQASERGAVGATRGSRAREPGGGLPEILSEAGRSVGAGIVAGNSAPSSGSNGSAAIRTSATASDR